MKRWYLLYCKRGEQVRAKQHLENQGVECFYPTVEVEKILRGKRQKVEEPLFPCYVFARFDYEEGPNFTSVTLVLLSTKLVFFTQWFCPPPDLSPTISSQTAAVRSNEHVAIT